MYVFFIPVYFILALNFSSSSTSMEGYLIDDPKDIIYIDGVKLHVSEYTAPVDVSEDEIWNAVATQYYEVNTISKGIVSSSKADELNKIGLGATRDCHIVLGGRDIFTKEEIVEWEVAPERKEFMYEIIEAKNFPAKKMYQVWGTYSERGQTYVYNKIYYRLKTKLHYYALKGKLSKLSRDGCLMIKHYTETGEGNMAIPVMREKYSNI